MTKTAIKKAAKAAREAKRQQKASKSSDVSRVPTPAPPASTAPPVKDDVPTAKPVLEPVSEPVPASAPPPPRDVPPIAEPLNPVPLAQPAPIPNGVASTAKEQPDIPTPPPPKEKSAPEPEPVHADVTPQPKIVSPPVQVKPLAPTPPAAQPQPPVDPEQAKNRQNVVTRTVTTLLMIFSFIGLLLLGHVPMIILVMICQALVYREVTALFAFTAKDKDSKKGGEKKKDPWSKTLNWYFFAVTNYFLYGESIIYYFKHVIFADARGVPFATNHRMISFSLYTIGFMGFVMSLKKGYLKQQFGLFCWVHMTLLLIVVSSHFIVNNILEGLIWFFVPASLVICNDVFAYIWGKAIGRTPLISLSPKKTVEGFVGAFLTTVLFSLLWGSIFMQWNFMICPVHDIGVNVLDDIRCTPNPVFVWREWPIPGPIQSVIAPVLGKAFTSVSYVPYHLHLIVLATFASLVAPFGGFFASGFKRAFDIKDFGDSIPGHGGMTDRMDCQFLMGVFVYVYHSSLIREHHVTVGSVLQIIVSALSTEEQLELLGDVRKYIEGQGIAVPCS
ncbi:hypothetical protein CYLTODRAFT_342994 [Cylindrobasidium torrendii FP15055 ss-10]|uniref:Phosphatidate cytidylyltransferase n=1 Tax=Cylindrobasidium torrendii FP15055 ss-10 TaxID=1314674 RepID=A0A0D7BRA0_9AGAR|nr:hypothetical protein CYLTODRAFT_342994 [Cylindrobasidium torrendii FP15055 ss-10]